MEKKERKYLKWVRSRDSCVLIVMCMDATVDLQSGLTEQINDWLRSFSYSCSLFLYIQHYIALFFVFLVSFFLLISRSSIVASAIVWRITRWSKRVEWGLEVERNKNHVPLKKEGSIIGVCSYSVFNNKEMIDKSFYMDQTHDILDLLLYHTFTLWSGY